MTDRKLTLITFLVVLGFFSNPSHSFSDREIRQNYASCKRFMSSGPSEQEEVARKTGIQLKSIRQHCGYLMRVGLQKALETERAYNRATRRPSEPRREEPAKSIHSCTRSLGCGTLQHCVNNRCVDVHNRARTCEFAHNRCPLGEKCVDGVCKW